MIITNWKVFAFYGGCARSSWKKEIYFD